VTADGVRFEFRGKSGIAHAVDLKDPRLARIVRKCQELPGSTLFQYIDAQGRRQTIGSGDVNAYLREITGDAFTAKDFRTWAGTILAAQELSARGAFRSQREAKSHVLRAIECVAKRLGNTRTVCRKSYIHPAVLAAYMDGETLAPIGPARSPRSARVLAPIEFAVVRVIRRRLQSRRA